MAPAQIFDIVVAVIFALSIMNVAFTWKQTSALASVYAVIILCLLATIYILLRILL